MMKKLFLIEVILFVSLACRAIAQDGPAFTQFYQDLATGNPALSGIDPFMNLNVRYKQAWQGFSEYAYTTYASVFGRIKKGKRLEGGNKSSMISTPDIYDRLEKLYPVRRVHGIGLTVNSVRFGPFRNSEVKAFYAYHFPLTGRFNISFGTSLGVSQQKSNYTELQVRDAVHDSYFQLLVSQSTGTRTRFLLDFGMALYSDKMYISATGRSLINEPVRGDDFATNSFSPGVYSIMAGYKLPLSQLFEIHPDLRLRYNEVFGLGYQASLRLKYKDYFYVGGGLQNDLILSFLFGLNVFNNVFIHYSYDHYRGDVNQYMEGPHELTVRIGFINRNNETPYAW